MGGGGWGPGRTGLARGPQDSESFPDGEGGGGNPGKAASTVGHPSPRTHRLTWGAPLPRPQQGDPPIMGDSVGPASPPGTQRGVHLRRHAFCDPDPALALVATVTPAGRGRPTACGAGCGFYLIPSSQVPQETETVPTHGQGHPHPTLSPGLFPRPAPGWQPAVHGKGASGLRPRGAEPEARELRRPSQWRPVHLRRGVQGTDAEGGGVPTCQPVSVGAGPAPSLCPEVGYY